MHRPRGVQMILANLPARVFAIHRGISGSNLCYHINHRQIVFCKGGKEGNSMTTDAILRIAFWVLLGGVLVMRVVFAARVRRAGERVMPDRQAVEREGRGTFALRVVLFFLLMGWLVLYAIYPPWL